MNKTAGQPDKRQFILKVIGLACVLIVCANLVLFSFRIIDALAFWSIIIIMALIAFPGMKYLNKKSR